MSSDVELFSVTVFGRLGVFGLLLHHFAGWCLSLSDGPGFGGGGAPPRRIDVPIRYLKAQV